MKSWKDRSDLGHPNIRLTVLQNERIVGSIQLGPSSWEGIGEISRVISSAAQNNGLGSATLRFLVKEYAQSIHDIGLRVNSETPVVISEKFKCFKGEALKYIYTSSLPYNIYSWGSYKNIGFLPFTPRNNFEITYNDWQQPAESKNLGEKYKSLEKYITHKHFSSDSSRKLEEDVFYKIKNLEEILFTISYSSKYKALRFHFLYELT